GWRDRTRINARAKDRNVRKEILPSAVVCRIAFISMILFQFIDFTMILSIFTKFLTDLAGKEDVPLFPVLFIWIELKDPSACCGRRSGGGETAPCLWMKEKRPLFLSHG